MMEVKETIEITKELVLEFSEISGDKNPIHIDEKYASTTRFGKTIAHGMLLCSFFSKLIAEKYPGPGSIYLEQNISFKKPCYVGETISVVVSLEKKEGAKYFLNTLIFNDKQQILVQGSAMVLKR